MTRKSHALVIVLLVAMVPSLAIAKQPTPADFPQTLIVSAGESQSYVAGATHSMYGNYGSSRVRYRHYGETVGTIGNREYTLTGKHFLTPGTYTVRFTKHGLEALTAGNKVAEFNIVGVRQTQ